ncbi:MAG: hypothetical protein JKY66_06745 [Spongiibacteraceae bacterium]|nr:hypothetical protein [Spongiibacteraceae bacterium]
MIIYNKIKDGTLPTPACAKTLGIEITAYCIEKLEIHATFVGSEDFKNPALLPGRYGYSND